MVPSAGSNTTWVPPRSSNTATSLHRLDGVGLLPVQLVEMCPRDNKIDASVYALLERNIGAERKELRRLWDELFALVVEGGDKPQHEAMKE